MDLLIKSCGFSRNLTNFWLNLLIFFASVIVDAMVCVAR